MEKQVAIYGGSFNPPGLHHEAIIRSLGNTFDVVLVVPCGVRKDKTSTESTSLQDRRAMILEAFGKLPKAAFDFSDLDENIFTPTDALDERYRKKFPGAELLYVVGDDLVAGGGKGESEIQKTWFRGLSVWETLHFLVIQQYEHPIWKEDLPPLSSILEVNEMPRIRSKMIRERVRQGASLDGFVVPTVAAFIERRRLYRS